MTVEHDALRALGLPEYGARAYEALITLRSAGAAEVSGAARVPRTRIYAVLKDLERRGFVEAEPTRPKRYRPVRPQTCLGKEKARFDALVEGAIPALEARYGEPATQFVGTLWALDGERAITERAERIIQGAARDLLFVITAAPPWAVPRLARALRAAIRRGVRVRTLLAPARQDLLATEAVAAGEVRLGYGPPTTLLVADASQALLVLPTPEEGPAEPRAIWNPSAEIVQILGTAIEPMWNHASPIELRGNVGNPRTIPGR